MSCPGVLSFPPPIDMLPSPPMTEECYSVCPPRQHSSPVLELDTELRLEGRKQQQANSETNGSHLIAAQLTQDQGGSSIVLCSYT